MESPLEDVEGEAAEGPRLKGKDFLRPFLFGSLDSGADRDRRRWNGGISWSAGVACFRRFVRNPERVSRKVLVTGAVAGDGGGVAELNPVIIHRIILCSSAALDKTRSP